VVEHGAYAPCMGWIRRRRQSREDKRVAAEELEAIIRMADEDTTLLGEQLSALGRSTEGLALDQPTRVDYQRALDAYEAAKRAVPRLAGPDEVSTVVDTLTTGRYLVACVRAALEGRPRPEMRAACFFNPQHGPSVREVRYTIPGGHGTRMVPTCAQDAARVEAGEKPKIRKIYVHGAETAYWEAGEPVLPYGKGWFTAGMIEVQNNQLGNLGGMGI
jgi:hypothetical protein